MVEEFSATQNRPKMETLELVNYLKLNKAQVLFPISASASLIPIGLNELRLGAFVLGGTNAVIREFSKEQTFC